MERLTKAGLDQLTAVLAERIGDPRAVPPTMGSYLLRHSIAHAIRGIEAYLELAAAQPEHPDLASSRPHAEELWRVLERAAAAVEHAPDSSEVAVGPQHNRHDERNDRAVAPTKPSDTDAPALDSSATLTTARIGQVLILRLAGELDIESATVLGKDPIENASALILDLSRLDFCDSVGLNTLLRLRLDAEGRGIPVHLAMVTDQVARLLEITGANQVFPIHLSVEDALAALACD